MGGESNEGEMGFKHGDHQSGISRVGIASMPLYAKADPFFSNTDWDPVVNGSGFSSSHYPSMVMDNPGMSCFPHYQPGSGSGYAADMSTSLLPFGDCGGGQISDDGVLGASPTGKRRQPEAESQWNKVNLVW